jgi:hypothetical protein
LTEVSEVRAASNIRAMMEAVRTPETSVDIYLTTRQYIPEYSELHTFSYEHNNTEEVTKKNQHTGKI